MIQRGSDFSTGRKSIKSRSDTVDDINPAEAPYQNSRKCGGIV